MSKNLLSEKSFTTRNNQNASQLRRFTVSRLAANMTGFISPIERWSDINYAPKELQYIWNQSPTTHKFMMPLHGYEAGDVRVDISREHVIVLLSRDYGAPFITREEYYCEIPIPVDANGKKAYVEVSAHFLIIQMEKKQRVLKRVVSAVLNLKRYFTLMLRMGLHSRS